MLTLSIYMLTTFKTTDAQVSSNTLESIVNQTGSLDESAQIDMDGIPQYIFGDLLSDTVYVANYKGDHLNGTVTAIDPNTYDIKNMLVGTNPTSIFGNRFFSNLIYVTNSGSGTVSVIDTSNNTVVKTIPVGINPRSVYGLADFITLSADFGNRSSLYHIYVVNSGPTLGNVNGSVSVIDPYKNTVVKTIPVGNNPRSISGILRFINSIYVANSGSGTVSVIDTSNNTVVKTIPVGNTPISTFGDPFSLRIYVVNSGPTLGNVNGSVSVIDPYKNTVVKTIPVGNNPRSISGSFPSYLYVANSGSDTVSVIDTSNNTVVKTIPVGDTPVSIFRNNFYSNLTYVANSGSGTVSVIDANTYNVTNLRVGQTPSYVFGSLSKPDTVYVTKIGSNGVVIINSMKTEVVAGVTFDLIPLKSGRILCDTDLGRLDSPINRFFYVHSGAKCIAKASKGFEFGSWSESIDGNSTRTVSASSGSPWTPFLDFFAIRQDDPATASPFTTFLDFIHVSPDDPSSTLTINRFGNYTAYFRAIPPPLPTEYWATLFSVSATAVVGAWLIPTSIGWMRLRKQISILHSYHHNITSLYSDHKLDEKDIVGLDSMISNIAESYAKGRISNEQHTNLKREVSALYEEIYRKQIDSLKESTDNNENRKALVEQIKEDITDAYSKGKIIDLHYNLLNERITKLTSKDDALNNS